MSDSGTPSGTLRTVVLSRVVKLIENLERDPEHVQTYYGELKAAIAWLMDTTFEATDPKEKARLAATEMRARLVLEAFRNPMN